MPQNIKISPYHIWDKHVITEGCKFSKELFFGFLLSSPIHNNKDPITFLISIPQDDLKHKLVSFKSIRFQGIISDTTKDTSSSASGVNPLPKENIIRIKLPKERIVTIFFNSFQQANKMQGVSKNQVLNTTNSSFLPTPLIFQIPHFI
jgi:hypothetical protein